jgi:hypothetical protein
MNAAENIEKVIKKFYAIKKSSIRTSMEMDGKVLDDAMLAYENNMKTKKSDLKPNLWRIIMKSRITQIAAAAAILIAVLYTFVGKSGPSAWAIEQTIEALRNYSGVYMAGTVMDEYGAQKGCELWMRANKSQTSSKETIIRVDNGVIQWVEDGSTYTYVPQNNTVYYENAIIAGMSQWPGPILLELFAHSENTETIRGINPATGHEQVTLLSSFIDAHGAQSYSITFDVKTKLPIELVQWNNLDRRGAPAFHIRQITYYEDLPDSFFKVEYPTNANRVEKELTIPESSIGLLSDPRDGIPTEGLSRQEAANLLLRQVYQAVINEDFDEFRKLCPTSAAMSDEFLRHAIQSKDPELRTAEIVEIGPIFKEGYSKIGLIVAVPCVVRTRGGILREDKMIVQFRNIGGRPSCVLHGPYGMPREIE